MRHLCERCTPPRMCLRCGSRYKKSHECKRAKHEVLYAETGQKPLTPLHRIGPKDRERFCTIECNFDEEHLHIGDITNPRAIHAHCDRRKSATKLLKYIPLSLWGVIERGDRLRAGYHGRWCRRCYALALRLLGGQTEFQMSRYEL